MKNLNKYYKKYNFTLETEFEKTIRDNIVGSAKGINKLKKEVQLKKTVTFYYLIDTNKMELTNNGGEEITISMENYNSIKFENEIRKSLYKIANKYQVES